MAVFFFFVWNSFEFDFKRVMERHSRELYFAVDDVETKSKLPIEDFYSFGRS